MVTWFFVQALGEKLVKSATAGDVEDVNKLLLLGANVNFETSYGYSALIKACRMQRVEIAEQLIALGANVNQASKAGCIVRWWQCVI